MLKILFNYHQSFIIQGNAMAFENLPYDPTKLPRELTRHFISASESDIQEMLAEIGVASLDQLFAHIPAEVKFSDDEFTMKEEIPYAQLITHMQNLAQKNNLKTSFIGDGLQVAKVPEIVPFVCSLRGLTTAYTPYQPERSQGTLQTLWVYCSTLAALTGFEAINASLYDRSTCLWEAINTALRLKRGKKTALVSAAIYAGDWQVLKTLFKETEVNLVAFPTDHTGITDIQELQKLLTLHQADLATVVFPQVNSNGAIEDFHQLTNLTHQYAAKAIAIIDPSHLAQGGLTAPADFGDQGADMIVGEGQHLAIGANFGGPGLGIFGIRYNEKDRVSIRATPGRYIGKGQDVHGNPALCMILSTREQHIRREKATSNICSNQSFLATLVGAANLQRGEKGFADWFKKIRSQGAQLAQQLGQLQGVQLLFPQAVFINEFIIQVDRPLSEMIAAASAVDLQLGVDVSSRVGAKNCLKISLNETHSEEQINDLVNFFKRSFKKPSAPIKIPEIPQIYRREQAPQLPQWSYQQIQNFYRQAAQQNVSPDDNIYPLGSCTMKYNPYINDYAAALPGFTDAHPQAPLADVQGSLEVLYEIQEMFKAITGLPALTTQPVAGAQGELVGLKMFQAYHRKNGEEAMRNVILIPKSAHGTNPATATVAGFATKLVDGKKMGIVTVDANKYGQIDMQQLRELVHLYNRQISGIMVTNPNTSGIFEGQFKEMAQLIHDVGGLVYMDGANMNAIAGWVNLNKMGVDAVHNNLHKTWTIPHGGGGPGDAIVAVSEKLQDFLPGVQIIRVDGAFKCVEAKHSIGSVHRHYGNFAHKVRCYTYLKSLGTEGVKRMSAVAVLAARYLYEKLKSSYPTLPEGTENVTRMHEFILTIPPTTFKKIADCGIPKAQIIAKVGKLFLDFGLHAPTVAFPEIYGLMIEPTESFSKAELDRFIDVVKAIGELIEQSPEVLATAPHFTPVRKVDEVSANKEIQLFDKVLTPTTLPKNRIEPAQLADMPVHDIEASIVNAHRKVESPPYAH